MVVVTAFLFYYAIKNYKFYIPSVQTMHPTLEVGEVYFFRVFKYPKMSIHRGDVVLLDMSKTPINGQAVFRIIGLPNEKIKLCRDFFFINDSMIPYVEIIPGFTNLEHPEVPYFAPYNEIQINADSVFVVGDNFWHSSDSRYHGAIPINKILGILKGPK